MNETTKTKIYFYTSLLLAIWFALTAWLWTYLANVFLSFPFGLAAFFLSYKGKQLDPNKNKYRIISSILIAGLLISLIALFFFK